MVSGNKGKTLSILIVGFELIILAWIGLKIMDKLNYHPFERGFNQLKKAQGFKYFIPMNPNLTETVKTKWDSKEVVYTSNADALNERFDYQEKKPKDTYRIIALGDSFTYGLYVDTKDNWTEILEDQLNNKFTCPKYTKFEVINLGVAGYDIPYEVEMYRRKGQKYNPDLLIWMLVDKNRIIDIVYPLVEKCLKDNPADKNKKAKADDHCWIDATQQIDRAYADEYLSRKFNGIYELYGGPINVVDIDGNHKNILKKTKYYEKLKTLDLAYYKMDELMFPDYHPNKLGHKYLADNIYDYLINNKLINCY